MLHDYGVSENTGLHSTNYARRNTREQSSGSLKVSESIQHTMRDVSGGVVDCIQYSNAPALPAHMIEMGHWVAPRAGLRMCY
jgi:hypothetical protein